MGIASECRAAQLARASPRGEPPDRPQSTCAGGLSVVGFEANAGRTPPHAVGRGSTSPTPRQIGDRTCRTWCRATCARFTPWRTGHPPTEHARAAGLGVVVCAANAGRAPPNTAGPGSSLPTPRQVGDCGFKTPQSKLPNFVARGPCAVRFVENQPTAHRARARWRTWRGCLRGHCGVRSTPHR